MIKIEHPEIDIIAQEYFDLISPIIVERAKNFTLILEQAFDKNNHLKELSGINWNTLKDFSKVLIENKDNYLTEAKYLNSNILKTKELKEKLSEKYFKKWVGDDVLKICSFFSQKPNIKAIITAPFLDSNGNQPLVKENDSIKRNISYHSDYKLVINKIIDYDKLNEVSQDKKATIAYWLTQRLNINTCPYCNRIPIHTVLDKNKKGLIHPTLDHFYPKSDEPFLALSFYNLIPSCYYCNSSLKGRTDMDIETHLHPYVDGFGGDAVFSVDYAKLLPQKSHPDNYNIKLTPGNSISQKKRIQIFGDDNSLNDKDGNKNLFKLEDIYQVHQDIVGELVVKAEEFKAKQENIRQFYSALATNDSELYQFYFGNYLNPNDHHKRPLAKLTRDIVLEILPEISF